MKPMALVVPWRRLRPDWLGDIAQLGGGIEHALAGLLVDVGLAVEGARDGADRDVRDARRGA